jgi:hypothetical protein
MVERTDSAVTEAGERIRPGVGVGFPNLFSDGRGLRHLTRRVRRSYVLSD